jgi:hypothetical protein
MYQRHYSRGLAWGSLCLSLALAGCASGPRTYSNASPGVDLSSYSTFGFSPQLGTDRGYQGRSILSTHLIAAARREMEALGYQYVEADPDLEVNFYLHTQEKVQATSSPSMGMGYYGYRGGMYSGWGGYDTTVNQYTEGTLNVDVVDRARKELVWEGVAVGRLSEKARENMGERVNKVMDEIFDKHPLAPAQ